MEVRPKGWRAMIVYMYIYIYIHTHTHTFLCTCIYRFSNFQQEILKTTTPLGPWSRGLVFRNLGSELLVPIWPSCPLLVR